MKDFRIETQFLKFLLLTALKALTIIFNHEKRRVRRKRGGRRKKKREKETVSAPPAAGPSLSAAAPAAGRGVDLEVQIEAWRGAGVQLDLFLHLFPVPATLGLHQIGLSISIVSYANPPKHRKPTSPEPLIPSPPP